MFASLTRSLLLISIAIGPILSGAAAMEPPTPAGAVTELLPRGTNPEELETHTLAYSPAVPLSNAQRMARGLPPNRPRMRHVRAAPARPAPSGGPAPPQACTLTKGRVRVAYRGPDRVTGWLSRSGNLFGEYQFTTDRAQALSVQVPVCTGPAATAPFDILSLNGFADFPFVGAVTGYFNTKPDLRAGSADFAYVAGTVQAPRGPAVPGPNSFARAINAGTTLFESNIWTLDSKSQSLRPSWVNANGKNASRSALTYVPSSGGFAIVGDRSAFEEKYGDAYPATFTFQPTA